MTAEEFDKRLTEIGDAFFAQVVTMKAAIEADLESAIAEAVTAEVPPHLVEASVENLTRRLNEQAKAHGFG